MNQALIEYINSEILPRYDAFDAAHRRDHVQMVIDQSLAIAKHYDVNEDMVLAIAAFHDTGIAVDRKTHHIVSGKIVRADAQLRQWFTAEQIETMAQAVEDHRASSDHEPRSIYGKIVAEADRNIVPDSIIRRSLQYGLQHYPEQDKEGQFERVLKHMHDKYFYGGYLKRWFPESPNVQRLEDLRAIIADESLLRQKFEEIYATLTQPKA